MWESDDRLAGDPVWELFQPAREAAPRSRWWFWAVVLIVAGLGWRASPAFSVVTVCMAVGWGDFVRARRAGRSIPDPWAAHVSSRFSYGWAFWKVGVAAFAAMFAVVFTTFSRDASRAGPPAVEVLAVVATLWMLSFLGSAVVTAAGLRVAVRSGMRVWVGEGVNQARTLLLSMLIVGFAAVVLMPLMFLLGVLEPGVGPDHLRNEGLPAILLGGMFACMFAGPVVLLVILDVVSRRVIADMPTKYGPKVAAVGRWAKPVATPSPSSRP